MASYKTFSFSRGDGARLRGVVVEDRGKLVDVLHVESATRTVVPRRAFLDHVWRVTDATEGGSFAPPSHSGVYTPAGFERLVLAGSGGTDFARRLSIVPGNGRFSFGDNVRSARTRGTATDVPQSVVALDIGDCDALPALGEFPTLQALRLVRVREGLDLARVAHLNVPMLALEHVDVRELSQLREWTWLEQLELRGFWQYNVRDVEWLLDLPNLKRLTLDLGGRRKNVEIYKRLQTAYAWPFDLLLLKAKTGTLDAVPPK